MTTDPSIDPELPAKVPAVGGEESKEAVVARPPVEFVTRRARARIAELFGQLEWDDGYDFKAERDRE